MTRLTFYDIRNSRIPDSIGSMSGDTPRLLSVVNEAIQRLILAGGNEGWWGGWSKMVFNVLPATDPYITTPKEVARIESLDVCNSPVRIQNEFYEFMEFGRGLQSPGCGCSGRSTSSSHCSTMQTYDRGQYPTMRDLTPGTKVRVYVSNASDAASFRRIFFKANDNNDNPIYDLDNGIQVNGFFLTFATPFVDSTYVLNSLIRVQKEETLGPVSLYEVDQTTGVETLLSTFAPSETNPAYRRYFIKGLPCQCNCSTTPGTVQVTAMCKLDFVPVTSDTDPLIINNLPAIKHECLAVRYGEMDSESNQKLAASHHTLAIRLLNQELIHFLGKEQPAMQVKPWGNATLQRAGLNHI